MAKTVSKSSVILYNWMIAIPIWNNTGSVCSIQQVRLARVFESSSVRAWFSSGINHSEQNVHILKTDLYWISIKDYDSEWPGQIRYTNTQPNTIWWAAHSQAAVKGTPTTGDTFTSFGEVQKEKGVFYPNNCVKVLLQHATDNRKLPSLVAWVLCDSIIMR